MAGIARLIRVLCRGAAIVLLAAVPTPGAAAQANPLSLAVVTQMLGYPGPELGGQYTAEILGYYRQAGLEERIVPYMAGADVASLVDRGAVSFGVLAADDLLAARARGMRLVAVMGTLQINPACLMW